MAPKKSLYLWRGASTAQASAPKIRSGRVVMPPTELNSQPRFESAVPPKAKIVKS
jgi:hypothetical protein